MQLSSRIDDSEHNRKIRYVNGRSEIMDTIFFWVALLTCLFVASMFLPILQTDFDILILLDLIAQADVGGNI